MESKCGFYFKRCNDSSVNRSSKCLNLLCIFEYWNSISTTCNNSSKWRRAERYWGRWCRFFLSSNIPALWICHSAVFHRGCGECHPSHVSFHASDLYQSGFTFKVEFLCTDIKLTWWMICQTKPELQSSIIQLQVMIPNVYTFTFNDTNVDVYHPATNNILRLFITVLYITDGQEASQRFLIKYSFCELYLKATVSCTQYSDNGRLKTFSHVFFTAVWQRTFEE